jgi:hypothetical protein
MAGGGDLMALLAVDPWAWNLARRVSAETGWRASDVYDLAVRFLGDRYAKASIENAFDLIVASRIPGEALDEAMYRLVDIAREITETKEETKR